MIVWSGPRGDIRDRPRPGHVTQWQHVCTTRSSPGTTHSESGFSYIVRAPHACVVLVTGSMHRSMLAASATSAC